MIPFILGLVAGIMAAEWAARCMDGYSVVMEAWDRVWRHG